MKEQSFGGDWTESKLACLKAYLNSYRNIFTKNVRASYFTTWYVDAFAGTGTRSTNDPRSGQRESDEIGLDPEASAYLNGSAMIALGLDSPFDKYLFVEKSKTKADELRAAIATKFPSLLSRCEIQQDDANVAISNWCKQRDWEKERAVVFLDPFGMQVDWEMVALLGSTKGIDLWYLFPFIARLLTHSQIIDESWRKRLDTLFGTTDWESNFYKTHTKTDLFGEFEVTKRDATAENIQRYIESRLRTCFEEVAPSLILRNSKQSPLFALCFAAANAKGAPTAIKIAKSILKEK
jgi:three-Cys-motif partner protein